MRTTEQTPILLYPFKKIGETVYTSFREIGQTSIFILEAVFYMFIPPFFHRKTIKQIYFFGVKTTVVIILTGLFTGMVLSLQINYVLANFGAKAKLGTAVSLSLIRELGPVISALMITGRAGSALTAEIGIMRITEQIDAIEAMALNPFKYLVIPNLLAGIISAPILNALFILVGILGGCFISVELSGVSSGIYFGAIADSVDMKDLLQSLYKSLSFGFLITWICCFKGYTTRYGAEGVGRATTEAVVLSSIMILVWDYFLTSILILK